MHIREGNSTHAPHHEQVIQDALEKEFISIHNSESADTFIEHCKECLDNNICVDYIKYDIEDPEGILKEALKEYY